MRRFVLLLSSSLLGFACGQGDPNTITFSYVGGQNSEPQGGEAQGGGEQGGAGSLQSGAAGGGQGGTAGGGGNTIAGTGGQKQGGASGSTIAGMGGEQGGNEQGGAGVGGNEPGGSAGGGQDKGPARYPAGIRHSAMSLSVVEGMKSVLSASLGRPDVFAKVGASNTVNTNFFHCFDGNDVDLGEHKKLAPSWEFFRKTKADDSHSSFNRTSLAATVGWGAFKTVEGSPSPIEQEVAAIKPSFAVVLLGTNDTYEQGVLGFDKSMIRVVEQLLQLKVVPLITTIPPRADTTVANALVPEMNAILRAIAQQYQIPFLDLWQLLEVLPDKGLVGDGVHLGVYSSGGKARGCWLTQDSLKKGMNLRNWISLEALDRARQFLLEGEVPEEAPPQLKGAGTWEDPRVIDALPFVDNGDTSTSATSIAKVYGCAATDEGGPEVVYRLTLPDTTKLSVRVLDGDGVDVDIHALSGPDAAACLARDDKRVVVTAGPGDLYLAVDTYVSKGVAQAGAYRLTVVPIL